MFFIILLLALAPPDSKHVVLTWDDTVNPAATTYTVKRSTGKCSPSTGFSDLAINVTEKRYLDYDVSNGQYCYTVIAIIDGMQSPQHEPINVKVNK